MQANLANRRFAGPCLGGIGRDDVGARSTYSGLGQRLGPLGCIKNSLRHATRREEMLLLLLDQSACVPGADPESQSDVSECAMHACGAAACKSWEMHAL